MATFSLLVASIQFLFSNNLPKGDSLKSWPVMVLSLKPRGSSGRITVSASNPGLAPLNLETTNENGRLLACHGPSIQEREVITGPQEFFRLTGRPYGDVVPWNPPQFSSVQLLSCVQLFATPWTAACQASLSITISWGLLKLMSVELVMPSNCLTLCHTLFLSPSIFPSIRAFFSESVLHIRWPKYSSFSFIISPANEYSGLISFRMDWLDLLAVQGTLKSLQQHTSKAGI